MPKRRKVSNIPNLGIVTPPISDQEDDPNDPDKWKDYVNLFSCDQCNCQIYDFRIYCRYCEKSNLEEWSYESYDLCPKCFQRNFPSDHPHPRESFSIRHMSYFNRDTSNLAGDRAWGGVIIERKLEDQRCGFCHEPESHSSRFIDSKRPLLRLGKSYDQKSASLKRDYFHRPYFWSHIHCALYSPEVYYDESKGSWHNVALALDRGKSIKCGTCRRSGATIGCFDYRCDKSFHVPCTGMTDDQLKNGMIFWCPKHNLLSQGLSQYEDRYTCDGCSKLLEEEMEIFSCSMCIDYYNSFDLCDDCFKNDHLTHIHPREEFRARNVNEDKMAVIQENQNLTNEVRRADRNEGPLLEDLYSLDFTTSYLDIHGRAPRWATHNSTDFPGTWVPQIPRWSLMKYTDPDDLILSNFLGRGTDAIECLLLGRKVIGIDVNHKSLEMAIYNCTALKKSCFDIRLGTACDLKGIKDGSLKLVLSHPPYFKCISYSIGNESPGDLSQCTSIQQFCSDISLVAKESCRVLVNGGRAVLGIGDNRESRNLLPVSLLTIQKYLENGFEIEEFILKRQRCCSSTTKAVSLSTMFSFLLLTHELVVVLRKAPSSSLSYEVGANFTLNCEVQSFVIQEYDIARRHLDGTIWTVSESSIGSYSQYICESFCHFYGVKSTTCQILTNPLANYKSWLPLGPFRTPQGDHHNEEGISPYEKQLSLRIQQNKSWVFTESLKGPSNGLPPEDFPIISLLIVEPNVHCAEIDNLLGELPLGSHFVIGTRDERNADGSYCCKLIEGWNKWRHHPKLQLREIVYVVADGWTRHPTRYTPNVTNIEDWRPTRNNLEIIHISYLVFKTI